MNLKNKTDEQLWDMLEELKWNDYLYYNDYERYKKDKYDIHKEIIRREKDNAKDKM